MRRLDFLGTIALAIASPLAHAQGNQAATGLPATIVKPMGQSPVASTATGGANVARGAPRVRAGAERATVQSYDVPQSRGLFASCDDNADDRLDLFETRKALADLGDPSNPNWFRRLDTDRDGYLDWPEFDRFYRDLIHDGGTLLVWLVRPLPPAAATPAGADAAPRRVIDLFDTNHDGSLDVPEAQSMLRELGVPANLIAMAPTLDADHDGKFSEAELAPAMQMLRIDLFAPATAPGAKKPGAALPPKWQPLDFDGSQSIDANELAAALRRIDPQLERWTARLLMSRDRNGDGRLTANELPAVETPDAQAMAVPAGKR